MKTPSFAISSSAQKDTLHSTANRCRIASVQSLKTINGGQLVFFAYHFGATHVSLPMVSHALGH